MTRLSADIAIIGSGFSGSILAMIARQLGRSVVLIERGVHPRFAIGESSTPLTNLLLEHLGGRYHLPELADLAKWGRWRATHPELAVGLKRGFSFFHHTAGRPFTPESNRGNELVVAASPNSRTADTHWYRPDFDRFLAERAALRGAVYIDSTQLTDAVPGPGGITLTGTRAGEPVEVTAALAVDASGAAGFLAKVFRQPTGHPDPMPRTTGIFAHFRDVGRWVETNPSSLEAPVPVDDTALHHVFDDGWIWVLRFNNGITSAGAALRQSACPRADPAETWNQLLARFPSIADQFANARPVSEFVRLNPMGFRREAMAGRRWAVLPSAAGFLDPLLSTGFPLTLLGVQRLARALEDSSNAGPDPELLRAYSTRCRLEFDGTAELVSALYSAMDDFGMFATTSLLYFAAASFLETTWRLHPGRIGEAFLMLDQPRVGFSIRDCCRRVRELSRHSTEAERAAVRDAIQSAIRGIDVAGLGDPARNHWHDVRIEDLFEAAPKLGANRREIEDMLRRCDLLPADRVAAGDGVGVVKPAPPC